MTARIAIIGAGMAGIACADALRASGRRPVIFEKSRGIGGRIATRRTENGLAFDHGAQFITVRTPDFEAFLAPARAEGLIGPWPPASDKPSIVGTPSMNAFLKPAAETLEIHLSTEIASLAREGDDWRVLDRAGAMHGPFSHLVLTAPGPQCAALLSDHPERDALVGDHLYAPSWTLMAAFDHPIAFPAEAARTDGPLGWIARNSSKPGRGPAECWVAQASAEWSRAHLERDAGEVACELVGLFSAAVNAIAGVAPPAPIHAVAHRWRYALVERPVGSLIGASIDGSVITAGDWRAGPRVELAFASGRAAAAAIIKG